ncbi:hypothetical protein PVAND_004664 [Polypedilum vanderplanki]|uniref:Uncharacterized protein n=1 Tax=Polypedilum vanderplanki TaxID=319348 RepID=A0A9J6BYE7_POLVA|nr:hypothetical protein PVAND_004664 [Polypedilum vanderplanki]
MFKFVVLCVSIVVCSAGHLPLSYSSVTYHPVHIVKEWKPEWSEWKPAAKIEEWKPGHADGNQLMLNGKNQKHQQLMISNMKWIQNAIVDYTADPHHGFQATVKREPTHYKVPVPEPKIIAHHDEHAAWW